MKSFNTRLYDRITAMKSWLCVGLDISPESLVIKNPDINDLIKHSKMVIDATRDFAVAYKPNLAFFERWGSRGFQWLEEILEYIGKKSLTIGDGKRGDIGNSAEQYAHSMFEHFGFDAVTINPYLGKDTILPFLNNPEKGVFVLCKTSNLSGSDFQDRKINGLRLYEKVADYCRNLNFNDNIGLVVGATFAVDIASVRFYAPKLPLLIPGVGAQGGDLQTSLRSGNEKGSALISISRGISFAGDQSPAAIQSAAREYVLKMRSILGQIS